MEVKEPEYTLEEQKTYFEILKDFKDTFIKNPELRAVMHNGSCQYKTLDGRKCAVGKYIPEEKYNAEIEGVDCTKLPSRFMEMLPVSNVKFWHEVQLLHDGYHITENGSRLRADYWLHGDFTGRGKEKFNNLVNKYCRSFALELEI